MLSVFKVLKILKKCAIRFLNPRPDCIKIYYKEAILRAKSVTENKSKNKK